MATRYGARSDRRVDQEPEEAINVFDFEPVCRANYARHFGYMASGIDDESAACQPRGLREISVAARRLVDVSKVDMSTDILGVKYNSPIVIARSAGSIIHERRSAVARAAK